MSRASKSSGASHGYRQTAIMRPWRQQKIMQQSPPPPMGEVLATIHQNDLQDSKFDTKDTASITESQYLASYNWLNRKDNRILVPGEPPAWTPLSTPTRLQKDSGEYFRDQNAARCPKFPIQPMVQAVLTENPNFRFQDIDIVACGSTLGNLLRFARRQNHSFRMLVEAVGNAVFFIRRENSPAEKIPNVYGYGHTFPEAYTTWSVAVKGSESHQRIMKYDFAGLKCLVRFAADGYLPQLAAKGKEKRQNDGLNKDNKTLSEDDLILSIKETTLSNIPTEATSETWQPPEITEAGNHIPQSAIFDLKTRSIRKKDEEDTIGEELARLWIAQIPNFVLAYHTAGLFSEIQIRDVREDIRKWEEKQQPALSQFSNLLNIILTFVRSSELGRLEITREEGSSVLELRAQCQDAGRALPPVYLDQILDEALESNGDRSVNDGSDLLTWDDDEDGEQDYTACSASTCGYCGHCKHKH